jgi:hypothetical protein
MANLHAALFAKIQFTVDGITYGRGQEIPTDDFTKWEPESLSNRLNNQHVEFRAIALGAEVAPVEAKASKKKDVTWPPNS